MRKALASVCMVLVAALSFHNLAATANGPVYLYPVPGASLLPAGTSLAVRMGQALNEPASDWLSFEVVGETSGAHSGKTVLADDQETVIFYPDQPFSAGELVNVTVKPGSKGSGMAPIQYAFSISPNSPGISQELEQPEEMAAGGAAEPAAPSVQPWRTVPDDFPAITVTTPANQTGEGYLFLSNFSWTDPNLASYLLIVDDQGEPVYYQKLETGNRAVDFKRLPNGTLAYFDWNDGNYKILDSSYRLIDEIEAGNGYPRIDNHDLLLLPNGHYLFLIYDRQTIDMSQVTPGGNPQAVVDGLVVQELDTRRNVVFEWRSWDHFDFTDSYVDLTAAYVDYAHGNAVEVDNDGNLLISSRHMAEITKIDRNSGQIIWRMGGKNNEFTFTNDPRGGFNYQHDIRRLPNGNISLFDNHNLDPQDVLYSRALEYDIDETAKTADLVWEYRNTPDTYAFAMGNAQRLLNGNTLIGWGTGSPTIIEAKPDKSKAFELALGGGFLNYRAFRFAWHGYPTWAPTLLVEDEGETARLTMSWNGATEIAAYRVYAGATPEAMRFLGETPKAGFETGVGVLNSREKCFFRVMPVDRLGRVTQYSDTVYNSFCDMKTVFMPMLVTSPGSQP